ncbi:LysR family transcriptional regulator [Pseudomonas sp. BN515]|uniref:LysR family transcriptional regulator n=1 Tax=Pseudomonas sp. BN515 TaxID=2567892 RepID=UPI0024567624|nr:LysR family transcriptional regulator [Pseudomonas sp. BN515]MDH4874206.1 LysR family transcriptional regulator [Pseudomonas sp. BN515]
MRLSLEQLAAFSAVASERSFSAAARKLNKSQSAISISISNLEIDLGVSLFDRSHRYPQLTTEGSALLRDAEAILNQCFNMENRANSLAKELETQVVIALDDAIPYPALADALTDFSQNFTHVDLNVLHPSAQDCLAMIAQEKALLGVICTRTHYPRSLQFKRLGSITFTNVAHRDHPLAKMDDISFPELSNYRQLIYLPFQDKLPTSEYLDSPNHWRVESYLTLFDMLRRGLGWATLPKRLMEDLNRGEELVELKLAAYPFTEWTVGVDLVWSSSARSGLAGTWLRETLGRSVVIA